LVVPEENVLGLEGEPFGGKCMVVSVFAKALYRVAGVRPVDPDFEIRRDKQQYELRVKRLDAEWDKRVAQLFEATRTIDLKTPPLWKGTPAARDRFEYWTAGVEAYFDASGSGIAPAGAERPITTREALKVYDPGLYALVDETMGYRERVDWRIKRR
jgi:hypothetical protein